MPDFPSLRCRCGKPLSQTQISPSGRRVCGCLHSWAPADDHLYLAPAPQPPSPAISAPPPSQNPTPAAPGGPTAPQTGPSSAPPAPPPAAPVQNPGPTAPASPTPVSGAPSAPKSSEDLRQKARIWRQENPKVYDLFVRLALKYHEEGRRRIGIKWLSEKVRFEYAFQYKEEFKINNNITTYFARMLVEDHPKLGELFEFRNVKY